MKCKVCGAYNEDYLEYCENCAAPLTPDEPEPAPAEDSYVASTGETPPAWGFVRAPQWPKPEFDANTVSEEDIPDTYSSRFNPRPAQSQSQAAAQQPAPPVPGERGYSNNVRVHAPVSLPPARRIRRVRLLPFPILMKLPCALIRRSAAQPPHGWPSRRRRGRLPHTRGRLPLKRRHRQADMMCLTILSMTSSLPAARSKNGPQQVPAICFSSQQWRCSWCSSLCLRSST